MLGLSGRKVIKDLLSLSGLTNKEIKMPHEKREDAEKEAQQVGIDKSQVTNSDVGYFIAPQGIKSQTAKDVYADCRARGMDKEQAAKIAWSIEKKARGN